METILTNGIISGLASGDLVKVAAYAGIFFVIWLEVRGMKKQLGHLNDTISKSFAQGEKRFESIEIEVHQIRLDLDKNKGVNHGNPKQRDLT